MLNTAAQVGTALGIAALATLAAGRTTALAGRATPTAAELVAGFRLAFLTGASACLLGALGTLVLARK